MATRTEKRLITLSNRRARLIDRIAKESERHGQRQALRGRLIDATTEQIKTELRLMRSVSRETIPVSRRVSETPAERDDERTEHRA
jgi:hypothetical protein